MSNKVNEAVKKICEETLIPGFYLGVKDKTVDKRTGSFWRDFVMPRSQDIVHDKPYMFWDEIRRKFPMLMPTDICPCEEGDYTATSEAFERVMVSQGYWWLGTTVDCDFSQFLRPGENPYTSSSFESAVQDHFLKLRDDVIGAFDTKEEYWAAQMAMNGELQINPKGGKPYVVQFKRDSRLEYTITEANCMWCNDPKKGEVAHRPWDDIRRMQDCQWDMTRGRTDTVVMNHRTCQWLKNAATAYLEKCKDVATAQILLPTMIRQAGLEMPPKMDGARLAFVIFDEQPINIYCVDTAFDFCDPDTGAEVAVNPLKDGKVYGFDLSGSNNSLGGRFAYGRIANYNDDVGVQKRYFKQRITDSGKSIKFHGESAPVALIECPNASWEMDVCGGNPPAEETK